jgi:cytoskeletal protein CcmA (bactofilin family)/Zn finger protein HypA/HybF involved in hydrogenase expression
MSLFSKKKRFNPDDDSIRIKNSVNLTCPECSFEQMEPKMAVSTYCRGCGSHCNIAEGKAVSVNKNPSNPYNATKTGSAGPRARPTGSGNAANKTSFAPSSTPTNAPTHKSKNSDPTPTPRTRAVPPTSELVRKAAASTGFFQTKVPPRDVKCFDCDREHQAPTEASSTLCPACGAYIALKDFDIKDNWNRRIKTRGNVTLHKKAEVTGITIRCHHLLVQGKLTGGVDCSGDFTLRSHGKIMGKVLCKRLIIEKRAKVEFSNPIECEDAIIDGNVVGNFTCTGKLHLKKKATLTGDINVATMAVEEGARHNGRMSIGQ